MPQNNLLITGGAGFIGSNFIPFFMNTNPGVKVFNLDKLTYAGNLDNLSTVEDHEDYTFIKGDICDNALVNEIFKEYKIGHVIHFAAESHVDNSIDDPSDFIATNIQGTFNLLNTAYQHWMDAPFNARLEFKNSRFHHISTDEVYGSLGEKGLFTEKTCYAPNSPYSASKASSDFLARSYFHTYGLNMVITNCSNNYGPKQHDEKLIPTIIRKALSEENIPIYGDGQNIRDWLYVVDHCDGILKAFLKGRSGETYNIGGNNERSNLQIANQICSILDDLRPRTQNKKYDELITFVKDRPGHDFRYGIDANKIENELEWKANEDFDSGIIKTINWYLTKYN